MKFGVEFPRDLSLKDLIELAKEAEAAGFDSFWATDLLAKGELWVTLTAIVLNTTKIRVCTDVTNPYTRHPVITAQALATLQELSGGRVILGMGAGIRNILGRLGIKQEDTSLALRESLDIIKSLLSGQEVNYEGKVFSVKQFKLPFASAQPFPPFYLACLLLREAELASEIADGILTISVDEKYLGSIIGTARKNSKGRKISMASWAIAAQTKDIQLVKEEVGRLICPFLANLPEEVLKAMNIDRQEVFLARNALRDNNYGALSEKTISQFALFGSSDTIRQRIEKLKEIGIDELVLHFRSKEQLAGFSKEIL